jgi:hypothetical protein
MNNIFQEVYFLANQSNVADSEQASKSSSQVNTSFVQEAQYSQPWPSRSFLFAVNELPINDDPDVGGLAPRYNENNRWNPPLYRHGFGTQRLGVLYRWEEGTISKAADCPVSGGTFRESSGSSNSLTIYRTQTLIWCNNFTQFLSVPGDASSVDVANTEAFGNRWWPPTFSYNGTLSRVTVSASEQYLASRRSAWIIALGLESYVSRRATQYGGLAGDLALVIGLVAFSCRCRDLDRILRQDRAWDRFRWRGHSREHGRECVGARPGLSSPPHPFCSPFFPSSSLPLFLLISPFFTGRRRADLAVECV